MYRIFFALLGTAFALNSAVAADKPADTFDPNIPGFQMRDPRLNPAVIFAGKDVLFSNRGSIKSKKGAIYEKGVDITGSLTIYEGAGTYNESCTVALHSDGKHRKWPGEVLGGIAVCFEGHTKKIVVRHFKPELERNNPILGSADIEIEQGKPHKFRIVEEKRIIKIYWNDLDTPALIVERPRDAKFAGHHIVIYDREPVASVRKSMKISNLKVVALP